jgi:hypothetical protein
MGAGADVRSSDERRSGRPRPGRSLLATLLALVAALVASTVPLASAARAQTAPPPGAPGESTANPAPPGFAPAVDLPTPPEVSGALPGQDARRPAVPTLDPSKLEVSPPDRAPAQQRAELPERRTAATKTYATDREGEFVTELSPVPLHYKDPQGRWQEINTDLVPGKDGRLHNKANAFDVSVAADAADASVARLRLDDNHSVGFGVQGAARVKSTTTRDAVSYAVSIEFSVGNSQAEDTWAFNNLEISADFDIVPMPGGALCVSGTASRYPSIEAYYDHGSLTTELFQVSQTDWGPLIGLAFPDRGIEGCS